MLKLVKSLVDANASKVVQLPEDVWNTWGGGGTTYRTDFPDVIKNYSKVRTDDTVVYSYTLRNDIEFCLASQITGDDLYFEVPSSITSLTTYAPFFIDRQVSPNDADSIGFCFQPYLNYQDTSSGYNWKTDICSDNSQIFIRLPLFREWPESWSSYDSSWGEIQVIAFPNDLPSFSSSDSHCNPPTSDVIFVQIKSSTITIPLIRYNATTSSYEYFNPSSDSWQSGGSDSYFGLYTYSDPFYLVSQLILPNQGIDFSSYGTLGSDAYLEIGKLSTGAGTGYGGNRYDNFGAYLDLHNSYRYAAEDSSLTDVQLLFYDM